MSIEGDQNEPSIPYEFYKQENGLILFVDKERDKTFELDLSGDAQDKRPPKEWWDNCYATIKKKNPDYTDEQIRGTCGKIWHQTGVREKIGDISEFDFDINNDDLQQQIATTIKNNIENESDMDLENSSETHDLTAQQLEENYWVETSKTKFDGSTAMMEKRISGCMEVTGKSREECSKEVKSRMKKEGSDNTNTTDVKDEEVEGEEEEEEKEDTDDTIDYVEVCPKELDMLKEKAKRLDLIEKELEAEKASRETEKADLKKVMDLVDKIQAERDAELEIKRQEKIKQLSTDYDIPEEKIKDKTVERLEEDMDLLNMAVKKNAEEEKEVIEIDMEDMESDFTKAANALTERYKIKAVK